MLVTGGASGLGRGTVERFSKLGAKVVIADLSSSSGASFASSLGDSAIFTSMDVNEFHYHTFSLVLTNRKGSIICFMHVYKKQNCKANNFREMMSIVGVDITYRLCIIKGYRHRAKSW